MAKIITDSRHYADIAAAIRAKNGETTLYRPGDMAAAILAITTSSGGGSDSGSGSEKTYLYLNGDTYDSLTGGWEVDALTTNGTVSLTANCIKFNYSNSSNASTMAKTEQKVNLSGYSTINFDMVVTKHSTTYEDDLAIVGVSNYVISAGGDVKADLNAYANPTADGVRRVVSVPIDIDADCYVYIHGVMVAEVYGVWLE